MPAGRPSKFDEYKERILTAAQLGAVDTQMAELIGVTRQTLDNWKESHPDFFAALKDHKTMIDKNVERSLYQRATGYSHPAVKIYADANTGEEKIVPYTEHYPPDTTACIFWLKNRDRENWRDRQEQIQVQIPVDAEKLKALTEIPQEDLEAAIALGEKLAAALMK